MRKLKSFAVLSLVLIMLVAPAIACSTSGTTTQTITETEYNVDIEGEGLIADFQPGVIVLTGDIDGQMVEMKMTLEAIDGSMYAQVTEATIDGVSVDTSLFSSFNSDLSSSIFNDENYRVDSVTITDTEITIEATQN